MTTPYSSKLKSKPQSQFLSALIYTIFLFPFLSKCLLCLSPSNPDPDSDSETKLLPLRPKDTVKPVRPLFRWISSHWKKIFVISCVFAVFLDPLFLYIPIINHDIKCLVMDKKLNNTAIALRSITDFSYLVDIILQLYICKQRNLNSSPLIDQVSNFVSECTQLLQNLSSYESTLLFVNNS